MQLPAAEGAELIDYAYEQVTDEKLYSRWIAGAQHTMSFDDFKRELQPPVFRSDAELMADVEKIMNGGAHGNI